MGNYYNILGITQAATSDDVKKAYRRLSLKFHPDKNDGDEYFTQMFKQINIAYNTLVDPDKRDSYDSELRSQLNAKSNAERVKKLEDELAYRDQLLRQNNAAEKKTVYSNGAPTQSKARMNSGSSSFIKITHVKIFLWLIIVCMIIAHVSKLKNNETSLSKEKSTVVQPKKKQKRLKKKKQILQTKTIDTTSLTLQKEETLMDSINFTEVKNQDTL